MNRPHFYQPFLGLLDFLIEIVEHWRIEEFSQGHIQTVTEFLDHIDRDFFSTSVKHTVNCRWRHARQICQFIRTYCSLLAYFGESYNNCFFYLQIFFTSHVEDRKLYAAAYTHLRISRFHAII